MFFFSFWRFHFPPSLFNASEDEDDEESQNLIQTVQHTRGLKLNEALEQFISVASIQGGGSARPGWIPAGQGILACWKQDGTRSSLSIHAQPILFLHPSIRGKRNKGPGNHAPRKGRCNIGMEHPISHHASSFALNWKTTDPMSRVHNCSSYHTDLPPVRPKCYLSRTYFDISTLCCVPYSTSLVDFQTRSK